jgi:hypothetical protein
METREEKIERLREERELEITRKNFLLEKFYISKSGGLSRHGWGQDFFEVGMCVKVTKSNFGVGQGWRRGIIEYIKIINGVPKIGVICGKAKLKFEKMLGQIIPDNTLKNICKWESLEVPERLTKMSTERLLIEFRKRRKGIHGTDEEEMYKKELYLREHVGQTNSIAQRINRKKKAKGDKRK